MSNGVAEYPEVLPKPAPARTSPDAFGSGEWFIAELLREQQDLTAVQRFAQKHEHATEPAQARYYRDLIPLTAPGAGEQYAFEVDLDACTGCKACVTACKNYNGLDEGETWRAVGQIVSFTPELPLMKMVTAACHHCAHPACMEGCPANAYEKNLLTGIVKHLDDQCIGCQYCILKCPYDVPKYSPSRGIVRKCDMCSSRLEKHEAPACVQACPNTAIRIAVVSRAEIAARSAALLPATPDADYTLPSTRYRSAQPLPAHLRAADDAEIAPAHPHWPLVSTLVLTQWGAGAMLASAALLLSDATVLSRIFAILAFGLHFLGMKGALFHLGRPHLAFRALLGLRRSWLSREVAAFGAVAVAEALAIVVPQARPAAAVLSLLAVYCSVMIYADTRRPFWAFAHTASRFFLSVLAISAFSALFVTSAAPLAVAAVAAVCTAKLACELRQLYAATDGELSSAKKSALLLLGPLRTVTFLRVASGVIAGIALPLALLAVSSVALQTAAFALWALGEVLERYLYFSAVVPLKMPGGLAT